MDASATEVVNCSTMDLVKSCFSSDLRPAAVHWPPCMNTLFQLCFPESDTCTLQKLGRGCGSALLPGQSHAGPQPAGKMDDAPEEDILPPWSLKWGGGGVITDWPLRWQAVTLRLHSGELGSAQIMGCAEVAWTFYCFVLFSIYIYLCLYVFCVYVCVCVG